MFLIFLFCLILLLSFIKKNKRFSINDPPGKLALPIIGNLLDISNGLPFMGLKRLAKEYGDVFSMWIGSKYTIVVSDPKMIREMLSTHNDYFLNRPKSVSWQVMSEGYKNLLAARDEEWNSIRKLVTNSFSKTKLKSQIPLIEDQSMQLVSHFKKYIGKPLNPKEYCHKFAMNIILKMLISKQIAYDDRDEKELKNLIHYCDKIFAASGLIVRVESFSFLDPLVYLYVKYFIPEHKKLKDIFRKYYNEHLCTLDPKAPRDLMDSFILSSNGKKDIDRVLYLCTDFILVGSDTSADTLLWFILLMVNHQEIQEKAASEIKSIIGDRKQVLLSDRVNTPYMVATIQEVLRFTPVAPLSLPRECKESIEINDYYFPKGTNIIINTYTLFHHEKYWVNPEQFNPSRFLNDNHVEYFQPFSLGPRMCSGKNLALDELYVSFANLLLNFKFKSVDGMPISQEMIFDSTNKPSDYEIKLEER